MPPGSADSFYAFSKEIQQEIMEHLPLKQRVIFGATCKRNRALVARVFQLCVSDLFKPFKIPYPGVRFMQTATGTVLSGSVIPRLSLPRQSATAFNPNDLDFYSPKGAWRYTLRFFELGTPYIYIRHSPNIYNLPAIESITWLTSHVSNPLSLNIMQCRGRHPYEATVQFHSTCVVGAIDGANGWFANPRLLCNGISIVNRLHLKLDTALARERGMAVIRKYTDRGFTFYMEYMTRHKCGSNKSCPATLRTSVDSGCCVVQFPRAPYGASSALGTLYPSPYVISWSNGGIGCTKGLRTEGMGMLVLPALARNSGAYHIFSLASAFVDLIIYQ